MFTPSAGWYPTAARTGKDHQPDNPGHHATPSIAHHAVTSAQRVDQVQAVTAQHVGTGYGAHAAAEPDVAPAGQQSTKIQAGPRSGADARSTNRKPPTL